MFRLVLRRVRLQPLQCTDEPSYELALELSDECSDLDAHELTDVCPDARSDEYAIQCIESPRRG